MNIEDLIAKGNLEGVDITRLAASLRGKESLNQEDINNVSLALSRLGTAVNTLTAALRTLETPTWLPLVRIGYPEDNPPLIADDSGNLRIQGNALVGGTVEAGALKVRQLFIQGLIVTNNSPSPGFITWSACTVIYDGVSRTVSGGSTDQPLVYWDEGNTSFTPAAVFTPQIGRFAILTNNEGVADEAWNKTGNKAIQRENCMFAFLEGFQPAAIEEIVVNLADVSNFTVIDDTQTQGVLLSIGVMVKAAPTGTPSLILSFVIDDSQIFTINPYQASTSFSRMVKHIRRDGSGDGMNVGDWFNIGLGLGYLKSLRFYAGAFAAPGTAAGEVYVSVWRAFKV